MSELSVLLGGGAPEPSLLPWLAERVNTGELRDTAETATALSGFAPFQWPGLADAVAEVLVRRHGADAAELAPLVDALPGLLRHLDQPACALVDKRSDSLSPSARTLLSARVRTSVSPLSVEDLGGSPDAAGTVALRSGLRLEDAVGAVEAWRTLPDARPESDLMLAFLLPLLVVRGRPRLSAGPVPHIGPLQEAALRAVAAALDGGPEWRAAALIAHVVPALPNPQRRLVASRVQEARLGEAWAAHVLDNVIWADGDWRGPAAELLASHRLGARLDRIAVPFGAEADSGAMLRLMREDAVRAEAARRESSDPVTRTVQLGGSGRQDGPRGEERFLNARMVWPSSRNPLPATCSLRRGATYELRLNIGGRDLSGPAVDHPVPFPVEELPATAHGGHWLDVRVIDIDFTTTSAGPPAGASRLFLPEHGPSWVCPCTPGRPHQCTADQQGRWLFIPVTAPPELGPARLGVEVLYQGNVLQCLRADFRILDREEPGHPQRVSLAWDLTGGLRGLEALSPRDAGIVQLKGADGTWHVTVNQGSGSATRSVTVRPGRALEPLVESCRSTLTRIHMREGKKGRSGGNLLGRDNGKSVKEFTRDLAELATVGRRLWDGLFSTAADRQAVTEALRPSRNVQIAYSVRECPYIPWSLVYDLPYYGSEEAVTYCSVIDELDDLDPAAETRVCPRADQHPDRRGASAANFLCPFGFWGIRHNIDAPPHRDGGRPFVSETVRPAGHPVMVAAVDLSDGLRDRHRRALGDAVGSDAVHFTETGQQFMDQLRSTPPSLVYFCCHCGPDPHSKGLQDPCLMLPTPPKPGITPGRLRALDDSREPLEYWKHVGPLVFINGCATAAGEPSATWLDFVETFAFLYAAGVVGTETEVEAHLATEVAEEFWAALGKGETVGQALHSVRIRLLRKNNLLGLTYTAHCFGDLRLKSAMA
ncbi:hypothetical protein JS756_31245 [Streptomyces actuosus]|uniref:CHAT domain-containing protein n=1 Tax=Streptomyces actuosus TaxID=1885 RepID=A0ABS2VZB9_STRAS|nr:hypothetical protein [Streptomyces actuosus]MBN0048497.1 hypothetical protein [Streptomyces actuosus]